jgi:hypothetical protein
VTWAVLARGATPWNPRRLKASFLRHEALAVLARGATPWNPRRLKASFLRHEALVVARLPAPLPVIACQVR